MSKSKTKISRRTLLRGLAGGAAVAVALPPLEVMFNSNLTAHADETPLPKRFGIFFWGNGYAWPHDTYGDTWTPVGTGTRWALSEQLAPFGRQTTASMQSRINVISGLGPQTNPRPVSVTPDDPLSIAGQADPHMRGIAVALTSDRPRTEDFNQPAHDFTFARPTIDQIIARDPRFYGTMVPKFFSLELGISQRRFHQQFPPDKGSWEAISQRGPNALNLPTTTVESLYQKLFGILPDSGLLRKRASLLDAVAEDARTLRQSLGTEDQRRLDAHLEHISHIQQRFVQGQQMCAAPSVPTRPGGFDTWVEPLEDKTVAMAELLAMALRCDLTRVFSVMFTSPGSTVSFGEIDINRDMHGDLCHGGHWAEVKECTIHTMQCFRRFLEVLENTTDVLETETLLDNTLVLGTSELGDGTHKAGDADRDELPVILAGNAGGAMNTGIHYREEGGNLSRVHLTILNAMGLETEQYGFNGGETREVIPGLLT